MWERTSSARQSSERLAERRRRRRRRWLVAFFVLLLLLLAAVAYGLQQSAVRISRIECPDADVAAIARQAMQGSYFGIIPRDSIFFFPEERIRADILMAHSGIAAVSIVQSSFSSIFIKIDERVPIARWCGSTSSPRSATSSRSDLVAQCYLFDARGFIFGTTSAISLVNSFAVYEPLANNSTSSPVGLTLPNAEKFPSAFDFARRLGTFGSPVSDIVLRADEVDDYLASGTRVTYLLGNEENAFTALASARADLNLSDGSVDYVDLRFDGKVYLKKKAVGSEQ
jgi:hypothetical protein